MDSVSEPGREGLTFGNSVQFRLTGNVEGASFGVWWSRLGDAGAATGGKLHRKQGARPCTSAEALTPALLPSRELLLFSRNGILCSLHGCLGQPLVFGEQGLTNNVSILLLLPVVSGAFVFPFFFCPFCGAFKCKHLNFFLFFFFKKAIVFQMLASVYKFTVCN